MTFVLCELISVGSDEARFINCQSESWQSQTERALYPTEHSLEADFWLTWSTYQWCVAALLSLHSSSTWALVVYFLCLMVTGLLYCQELTLHTTGIWRSLRLNFHVISQCRTVWRQCSISQHWLLLLVSACAFVCQVSVSHRFVETKSTSCTTT